MNTLKAFKELMSAQYNPSTNTITGCSEGSIIYNHEYRHLIQQEKFKYFTFVTLSIWVGLYLLIISENYKIAYVLLLLLILPEIDAWVYALYKKYYDK